MKGGDQDHMMGGGMKGGDHDHMMGGGMMGGGQDHMMCGGMMGGDADPMSHMMGMMERMSQMMAMMHEKLEHAGDRIASLKTELKITEAQTPAWNKFADALIAAAKSTDEMMESMHKQMMKSAAMSLPEKLEHHAKMAAEHVGNLNAIKAALGPLYASFSDEQKKLADGLKIGPMGLM
ncbi:MAG TPA: Spy/CpxP family protein refolding chaperone [Methylocella sp.]|nr:Spy/CpxP family protein refolding chaperone [Methylocella sp.]